MAFRAPINLLDAMLAYEAGKLYETFYRPYMDKPTDISPIGPCTIELLAGWVAIKGDIDNLITGLVLSEEIKNISPQEAIEYFIINSGKPFTLHIVASESSDEEI